MPADVTIVGVIMICIAGTIIILGVEKLLRRWTARRVKKISNDFDKIMEEMEEWEKKGGDEI